MGQLKLDGDELVPVLLVSLSIEITRHVCEKDCLCGGELFSVYGDGKAPSASSGSRFGCAFGTKSLEEARNRAKDYVLSEKEWFKRAGYNPKMKVKVIENLS